MDTLRDIFAEPAAHDDEDAPPLATRPAGGGARIEPADPEQVDRDFRELSDRRRAAQRAAVARQNAATARQVAQSFAEYGRAFRKMAATKGSTVDHAVAVTIAAYCEEQADDYAQLQAHSTAIADREGSL